MFVVFSTNRFYLLDQPVSDFLIQVLDVEVLVLFVEVEKQLLFVLNLRVDPQTSRDFLWQNVHKVLIAQILKQDLRSLSSVLSKPVEDAGDFLSGNIHLMVHIAHHFAVLVNLVVNKLVIPIHIPFTVHMAV